MNQDLWKRILNFDFDHTEGEYPFSLRLATENYWTSQFTEQALLEYKKFMYLAATCSEMVSPSEIVDIVWHQHLMFTHSYTDFCLLLGKNIQHIPSTHSAKDAGRFKQAAEFTQEQYYIFFGKQPKAFWKYNHIYDSLHLKQSAYNTKAFLNIAVPALLLSLIPAYFLLLPVYRKIGNPAFPLGVCALAVILFLALHSYNKSYLKRIISNTDADSFIHQLQPYEVIYLKEKNVAAVINGHLEELLHTEYIVLDKDNNFIIANNINVADTHKKQIIDIITQYQPISHRKVLNQTISKPVFVQITNSLKKLEDRLLSSQKFMRLFIINFILLAIITLIIYTRVITGFLNSKGITYIAVIAIIFTYIAILHLKGLKKEFFKKAIPSHYLENQLSSAEINSNWQWAYLLKGTAILSPVLITLAYPNYKTEDSNSGSSCGGSSCGSGGCGGCGGD